MIDPMALDPAFREALDWECFGKYPLIILVCGLIILILDFWEGRKMNVEHKIYEKEEKPKSMEEMLQQTFNEGVKTGVKFALERMQQLQTDIDIITGVKHE